MSNVWASLSLFSVCRIFIVPLSSLLLSLNGLLNMIIARRITHERYRKGVLSKPTTVAVAVAITVYTPNWIRMMIVNGDE
mmetsp:Transcript_881/g.985  ORF Transcript_881/g.985 Transcript_881/m.985 type:complete len:80 (-) Transcript_881:65-304(-)